MHSLPLPIAAFLAGVLSFLSPCVLPLVPGYVSLISGVSVEELQTGDKSLKKKVFLHAVLVIILFGLHLTGILRIPFLYRDTRLHNVKTEPSPAGSFLLGFAFAFGW